MSKPMRANRLFPIEVFLFLVLASFVFSGCREEGSSAQDAAVATGEAPHDASASGASDTSDTSEASNAPSAAGSPANAGSEGGPGDVATTPHVHAAGETAARNPNERPLPSFEGKTLDGKSLSIRDLLGARILLFFFNPETEVAPTVGRAVNAVAAQAAAHNFKVVGIGIGSDSSKVARFASDLGLTFPVIDDSSGEITQRLRLRAPNALIGVDPEGYLAFVVGGFPKEGDAEAIVEADLRSKLRLPEPGEKADGALYDYPKAPKLGVVAMSDGARLETSDLKGRAALVIFFLHTCPHCHKALASIKTTLAGMPEATRPRLVAISVQNAPSAIRSSLEEQGLDYFDPYLDPGSEAAERWGVTGGVPVVVVVDKEGRIRHRSTGWDEKRDPGIIRMMLAEVAGERVPMLLDPTGYSGNDVCGICHEKEYATWQYTAHASAYDTLVTHAAERRTDCIGCHVVGFEQPGGYDFKRQEPYLENVGCESCHGRGGPHLTPNFVPNHDYSQVCVTCHNPEHSLAFDYATFHPRISHAAIAALSDAERAKLLAGGGPKRDLLPTQADYVGSDACASCHPKEFATWQASPHGHAIDPLEKAGKSADAACLVCHTTAYGKPGGFSPKANVAAQPDLARVGCESCHGPGGDHVGKDARRVGTILSLGDKCDSCAILKICGTCHDDANDPGFQFRVEARIEKQRHGSIQPAASSQDRSAFRDLRSGAPERSEPGDPDEADRALLHEAFERVTTRAMDRGLEHDAPTPPASDPS
jgi:peroxiredoxin